MRDIAPYPPGKPIEELEREYGVHDAIKLASNENPLGPSPKAIAAISSAIAGLNRYPDGSGYYLTQRLADKLNVAPEQIVLGNGSNEIIELIIRTFLQPGDEVISPFPSFLMYDLLVRSAGCLSKVVPLRDFRPDLEAICDMVNERTRLIFISNPNNPTGTILTRDEFERFLNKIPHNVIVAVDEAYKEFVQSKDYPDGIDYIRSDGVAVAVLRTFSKAYGLAGLRIGYGVMPVQLAGYIHRVRQPFNTNSLAQVAALAALDDHEFLANTLDVVHRGIEYFYRELKQMGVRYYSTETNFLLIDVVKDAKRVYEDMLHEGVIVRAMNAYGYPTFIRVTAGAPSENERFIIALKKVLCGR
ncbi:MAG: histidinol-phosphate transaminase [Pseudomonadota bacterium]